MMNGRGSETTLPSGDDDPMADLAADLADRLARGEAIDPDALAALWPGREDEVRQLYATIRDMVRLGGPSGTDNPAGRIAPMPGGPDGLFGEFRLIREAGRGGMGVVYEAEQIPLRRRVAVKILPQPRILDPRRHDRFLLEAQAAALLDHRSIVAVHGVGTEQDIPYLVMQFVDGPTLAGVIEAYGGEAPPPANLVALLGESSHSAGYVRAVARIGRDAADALDHAHERGIVHRDIKPANLMLDPAGQVLITDFGLAQIQGDSRLTQTGDVLGTLRYMSPEQARGRRAAVDARSDVYSLGATLHELLTLAPVVDGADRVELMRAILEDEAPSARSRNPAVPRDLDTILAKCLARSPDDRYASARDLADDLERFLQNLPIKARAIGRGERLARWGRRNRRTLVPISVSATAFVLLLIGSLAWSNRRLSLNLTILGALEERTRILNGELQAQRLIAEERRILAERHLDDFRIRQADEAIEQRQFEQAQDILRDARPEGSDEPRDFAWRYLWRQATRDFLALTPRSEDVDVIGLSDDFKTVATGSSDGTFRIRATADGRLLQSVKVAGATPSHVSLSGDGRWALLGLTYPDKEENPEKPIFVLWDRKASRIAIQLEREAFHSLEMSAFLPDHRHLLTVRYRSGIGERLDLWEIDQADTAGVLKPIRTWDVIRDVRLSADRSRFVCVDNFRHRIQVHSVWADRPLFWTEDLASDFSGTGISHDGTRVGVSRQRNGKFTHFDVIVCDVDTGRQLLSHPLPHRWTMQDECLFSPDDRAVLFRGVEPTLHYFDLSKGTSWDHMQPPVTGRTGGNLAAFLPNSDRILHQDHPIGMPLTILQIADRKAVGTFPGMRERVDEVFCSPDGRYVHFLNGNRAIAWDLHPEADPQPAGHKDEAWAVAYSPDGTLLYSGADDTDEPQTLKVWESATGKLLRGWKPHEALVSAIAVRPGGAMIATAGLKDDEPVKLWDPETGTAIGPLDMPLDRIGALAFHPDGKLLAGAGSGQVISIWDVETRKIVRTLEGHEDRIRGLSFSPDGRSLASVGNDRTARIWTLDGPTEPWVWRGGEQITAVAYAPDGRSIAWCDVDGVLHRYDLTRKQMLEPIQTEPQEYLTVAYSPDARTIAVAGHSGRIHLHDALTGQELFALSGPKVQVNGLAFSPDGGQLAATWHDGSMRIFRSGPASAVAP